MSFYGENETWKITYYPQELNGGIRGVMLVEAPDKHAAMYTFSQENPGLVIASCKKLLG